MKAISWNQFAINTFAVALLMHGRVINGEGGFFKVKSKIWRTTHPDFQYPEFDPEFNLQEYIAGRDDFGIALAGGGYRGAALAHGAARALRRHGILQRARYMTTSSGSVWLGIPMYYQTQDTLDEFLGKAMPPEQLTPEALTSAEAGTFISRLRWPIKRYPKGLKPEEEQGNFTLRSAKGKESRWRRAAEAMWGLKKGYLDIVENCFRDVCACVVNQLIPEGSLHELYDLVTGYAMLLPFDLARPGSTYCHPSQLKKVRRQLGPLHKIYTNQDMSQNLPFLISQSAAMSIHSGTDQQTNPLRSFPIESSALYRGIPGAYFQNETVGEPYRALGDIFLEPFAWGSAAAGPVTSEATGEIKVHRRRNSINLGDLAEWQGAATVYFGDFQVSPNWYTKPLCGKIAVEKILPHAWMWSPFDVDRKGVPVPHDVPISDAGVYDDLGHHPLLRRKVSKMVIYLSSAVHNNYTGTDKEDLNQMTYLIASFGQPNEKADPGFPHPPGSPTPFSPRDYLTVFEPSEFAPLWEKITSLYMAGKPVVIRDTFTTVDNHHFGIVGGQKVEIVWVVGLPIPSWRAALPTRTADFLPKYLPNLNALESMNSRFYISAISQYADWLTEQAVVKEINAMLGKKEVETEVIV